MRELEHSRPADIEAESFRIIGAELAERGIVLPADQAPLVKRAIHTTADFDYARNLVFTPGAVEAGVRALRAGTPILTDTNMARSGINRGALERLGISVHCFMADPEVARRAAEAGTTRAAAAVDQGAALWPEGIYAVGNAPTALIRMAQLIRAGAMSPALILAVPVGFVNVVESKEEILALARERDIPVTLVTDTYQFPMGQAMLTIYPPVGAGDLNEQGLTFLCSAGDFDALITGDMAGNTEKKLVERFDLPDIEVLVVGHHGSRYSSTDAFLQQVRPETAIISVGDNSYGHPTQETMDRLSRNGAAVYRTDRQGNVLVTVNGGT